MNESLGRDVFLPIKIWMKMENDIGGVPRSVERDDSRHPENSEQYFNLNSGTLKGTEIFFLRIFPKAGNSQHAHRVMVRNYSHILYR